MIDDTAATVLFVAGTFVVFGLALLVGAAWWSGRRRQ